MAAMDDVWTSRQEIQQDRQVGRSASTRDTGQALQPDVAERETVTSLVPTVFAPTSLVEPVKRDGQSL